MPPLSAIPLQTIDGRHQTLDDYAGKAARFGLIKGEDAHLNDYVTSKALDGLFLEMADEERAIRKDPLGQASSLIKRVFGALH